ncbi:MAG TPA: dihydroorotase, partial [Candidatus Bathyarchaeota archaeon]|nr:dihydroorotase [Candidatus Bathyarchaeota archaeon]
MLVDTVLLNCKVYLDKEIFEAGIAIENGKIAKIGKQPNLPEASEKIDLKGCLALPGLIDVHVHLRDQELAYKETFYTGTAAAAAGGITTVLDMPNNKPTTMDESTLQERMRIAKSQILTNVGFYSAFPEEKAQITQLAETGAVAFKIFLVKQIGGLNIDDDHEIIEALISTKKLG